MSDRDKLLLPLGYFPKLEQFPDLKHMGEFDPDNLTADEVLQVITVALAATRGSSNSIVQLKAQAKLEEQFARGRRHGLEEGARDGYERGYREGLEDGRREALDCIATEEAERASLKAAARARRLP